MQAYARLLVGAFVSALWCIFTLFFLVVLFFLRKTLNMGPRNPPLLFLSGTYLAFDFVLNCTMITSPLSHSFGLCTLSLFSGSAKFTLHGCAILLKGLQYLVMTKDSYRRKFPRFKSNNFVFILCCMVFLMNTIISGSMIWGIGINPMCSLATIGSMYSFVWLLFLLIAAIIISRHISWNFDSYGVGKDLQYWFYVIGIFGVSVVGYRFARSFTDDLPWQIERLIAMALNVGAFVVTTVIPIFKTMRALRRRRRVREYADRSILVNASSIEGQCSQSHGHGKQIREEKMGLGMGGAPSIAIVSPLNEGVEQHFLLALKEMVIPHKNSINEVLEYVFTDPARNDFFHDFCKQHFVPEIGLFLDAVYQHKTHLDEARLHESFGTIVSDFIEINAPYEININSFERFHLLHLRDQRTKNISMDEYQQIFDSICWAVFDLFAANFLLGF